MIDAKRPGPKDTRGRTLQFALGSLMAFIAGVALTLGLVMPALRSNSATPALPTWHAGPNAITSPSMRNCTNCHPPAPASTLLPLSGQP